MNTDFPPLFSWVLHCPAVVDYKWRGCAFSRWSTGRLLLRVTVLIQQSRLLFTGCSILLSFSTGGWDSASAVFSPKQQSGLCSTNLGVAAQGLTYQSVFCPWAFLNLNLQYGTITAFEKKKTFSTVKMYVLIALPFINRNDGGSFVNQWIYSNSFIAWHAI